MSGTTAITVLVVGDKIYVANVGESRAVLAVKDRNRVLAEDLSYDQMPFREDECERIRIYKTWANEESEGGDPPRLWVLNGMYPGTAFTRSVGDCTAEGIGVTAEPEVSMVHLSPNHLFFVVASDGIFEFLPSQAVVDMVIYKGPKDTTPLSFFQAKLLRFYQAYEILIGLEGKLKLKGNALSSRKIDDFKHTPCFAGLTL
ncbi:hypothetical protein Bca4012_091335 [Brassica carinata]